MKISLQSWRIAACLLFGWFAQAVADETSKLPLVFSKLNVDFGQAHEGDKVHLEFPFKNQSSHTVYIARVRPSCMLCTTAKINSWTVAPGGTGLVTATFDTKGMRGHAGKLVYVVTGSMDHEQVYRLGFTGEVLGDVYPKQDMVTINPFLEGQTNRAEFSVISLLKSPLEFNSMNVQISEADPKQIIVKKVAENPVKKFGCAGTEYRFQVTFLPGFKPPSSWFGGNIELHTTNSDYPVSRIMIYGGIPRKVVLNPDTISADVPPHKQTLVEKTIELTSREHLPVQVISHELHFEPPCTVTVEPTAQAGTVKVRLAIQCDGEDKWAHGVLVLKLRVGDKPDPEPYVIPLDVYAGPHPAQPLPGDS